MGLFDYVKVEVPLPDGRPAPLDHFQTKQFEMPYMETYTIKADGRLIHDKPRYDCDPPGATRGQIDTNFHGVLNFYDYDTKTGEWREFDAKFTDGELVYIERIEGRE